MRSRHRRRGIPPLFALTLLTAGLLAGSSPAQGATLVAGCPPSAGKFKPKRLDVVCSASLAHDGYRIKLFKIDWTKWKTNAASGTATARYPKPFRNPKLWKNCTGLGACRPPMVKGPAEVELSDPLNCRRGPNVFATVAVRIPGTVYAKNPWTWRYYCPRPKRELLRRGKAVRSVKRALGNYYTFWRRSFSRSARCTRAARHVMRCRARWQSNATDNGGAVVLDGRARGRVKKGLDGRTYVKLFVQVAPIGATEDHSFRYWINRSYK